MISDPLLDFESSPINSFSIIEVISSSFFSEYFFVLRFLFIIDVLPYSFKHCFIELKSEMAVGYLQQTKMGHLLVAVNILSNLPKSELKSDFTVASSPGSFNKRSLTSVGMRLTPLAHIH